ncbi:hypothetical protein CFP56_015404, partial [Quercus suber]
QLNSQSLTLLTLLLSSHSAPLRQPYLSPHLLHYLGIDHVSLPPNDLTV